MGDAAHPAPCLDRSALVHVGLSAGLSLRRPDPLLCVIHSPLLLSQTAVAARKAHWFCGLSERDVSQARMWVTFMFKKSSDVSCPVEFDSRCFF